jgi:hypothetical protein
VRITIDLSDEQAAELRRTAEILGIEPEDLARAAFTDWLARPQHDLCKAAEDVLRKNRALYEKFGDALDAANRQYRNALKRLAE